MRIVMRVMTAAAVMMASSAAAEFAKVDSQDEFISLIQGKELRRPFVRLEVSSEGQISGMGAAWPVTGSWTWQEGYFCRDLFWDGDPLGYNCQEVRAHENRIIFTSDRGTGDSAEFRLR
ncbi:dihydrodipicolinate reductase [Roseobacter sinensis]|uniref:Dihydrodipicolinate reductase n=1 Tax=Roseobacter sinensis TaxID=2931391 RepID=A0ABT3B9I8_9RHOB|nr:dihydrodipicolinate reductase [Roseobacter sp. WL0113]MCV3270253.1 dihydrodipicolinate reductase [Roseobacter sp. WL0113]